MQTQRASSINLAAPTEEDILMHSPFPMHGPFDKQCGRTNLLSGIIHGDNSEDWTMDCDEDDEAEEEEEEEEDQEEVESSHHSHRLVRGGDGMVSHDSADSIRSTSSSTSSTQELEPELSQSFGSTTSFDLKTPSKPYLSASTTDSLQRYAQSKTFQLATGFERQVSVAPSQNTAMQQQTPPSHSANSSLLDPNQQRQNLGGSLGIKTNMQKGASNNTNRLGKPAPPGLAGRLKIQLPISSSSSFNSGPQAPQTPGGHVAIGARDGAADGGPPLSPFEPPTPLYGLAPYSAATSKLNTTTSSPSTPSLRPKLQSRHTITSLRRDASSVLGMSPITSQFAAVSMRKKSISKASTLDLTPTQRSDTFESTSTVPTSPSNSNYSPISTAKALSLDLDVPCASPERRTSTSSTASNSSSTTKKRNDVNRSSALSNRTKMVKTGNKMSPYPLSRDEGQGKAASSATAAAATPPAPSLLKDIVKPPMLTAPAMVKSISEPVPTTISAKHLAHRTLHPIFSATYTLGDELGSGGFGFVVSATRDRDGMPVAVKFIFKNKVPSHGWVRDDEFGAIPMEAFVLKVVDSPFVVKFVDLFDDDQFFYLVMEHHGSPWKAPNEGGSEPDAPKSSTTAITTDENAMMEDETRKSKAPGTSIMTPSNAQPLAPVVTSPIFAVFPPPEGDSAGPTQKDYGSLSSNATKLQPRPAAMARTSSCDLFECIEQHSRLSEEKARWVFAQIVEAVYYLDKRGICHRDIKDENCVVDEDFNVKLIDFGSSVITDPRRPTPYFNRFFGTMTFASSEILQGKQYRAPHAEIWSLGVLLSILLSGECPFADPSAAMKGKISRSSTLWSSDALNLLMACLVVNPDKRATIEQIRNHPWVAKAWLQPGRQRPDDDFSFVRPT